MKVLKVLAIILVLIIGLGLVLIAVSPSKLTVEKSITIDAPTSVVFANVSCLDKWPAWSAWDAMDPEMKNEYSENPCGIGAWNSWDGPQTGKGKQTIDEINGNESIIMSLVFEGFEGTNYANWKFEEVEEGTKVTWTFDGAPSPFLFRPMNLMMKGVLEKSYEDGLNALKDVAENGAAAFESAYEVKEVELPETKYLLISGDVVPSDIGEFYGNSFGTIMGYMAENGVEMAGHPTGLFYNWTDTLAKMSAAIPVNKDAEGNEAVEFRTVEGSKALQIDYYGAYDEVGPAHEAMDAYMSANNLDYNGSVREVYVTDPMSEQDTSKWLTHVIYPVKAAE